MIMMITSITILQGWLMKNEERVCAIFAHTAKRQLFPKWKQLNKKGRIV